MSIVLVASAILGIIGVLSLCAIVYGVILLALMYRNKDRM